MNDFLYTELSNVERRTLSTMFKKNENMRIADNVAKICNSLIITWANYLINISPEKRANNWNRIEKPRKIEIKQKLTSKLRRLRRNASKTKGHIKNLKILWTKLKTLYICNIRRLDLLSQLSKVNTIDNYFLYNIPLNTFLGNFIIEYYNRKIGHSVYKFRLVNENQLVDVFQLHWRIQVLQLKMTLLLRKYSVYHVQ